MSDVIEPHISRDLSGCEPNIHHTGMIDANAPRSRSRRTGVDYRCEPNDAWYLSSQSRASIRHGRQAGRTGEGQQTGTGYNWNNSLGKSHPGVTPIHGLIMKQGLSTWILPHTMRSFRSSAVYDDNLLQSSTLIYCMLSMKHAVPLLYASIDNSS